MVEHLKRITKSQFEAALAMLHECIANCPDTLWDAPIAKYPFWQVAYHTLCFVDYYLAPCAEGFHPRPDLHPAGLAELEDEYPSRTFSRDELMGYSAVCLEKLRSVLDTETAEVLEGPSGFARLPFSRAELHLYNLRHVQHHAGQLGAVLRRSDIHTRWASRGWP